MYEKAFFLYIMCQAINAGVRRPYKTVHKIGPSHFVDSVLVMQLSSTHIWLYVWSVPPDHALLPYV